MKTMTLSVLLLPLLVAFSSTVSGLPITFNLRDTSATAEIESGSITRTGLHAALTPTTSGGTGSLNQTSAGFGIDSAGADASNQIDNEAGIESISIVFSHDVRLTV